MITETLRCGESLGSALAELRFISASAVITTARAIPREIAKKNSHLIA